MLVEQHSLNPIRNSEYHY